jgi:hypothetical protein
MAVSGAVVTAASGMTVTATAREKVTTMTGMAAMAAHRQNSTS